MKISTLKLDQIKDEVRKKGDLRHKVIYLVETLKNAYTENLKLNSIRENNNNNSKSRDIKSINENIEIETYCKKELREVIFNNFNKTKNKKSTTPNKDNYLNTFEFEYSKIYVYANDLSIKDRLYYLTRVKNEILMIRKIMKAYINDLFIDADAIINEVPNLNKDYFNFLLVFKEIFDFAISFRINEADELLEIVTEFEESFQAKLEKVYNLILPEINTLENQIKHSGDSNTLGEEAIASDKIWWRGTEGEIIYLFEQLSENEFVDRSVKERIYVLISKHFMNKKQGLFNPKQLSQAAQNFSHNKNQKPKQSEQINSIISNLKPNSN